MRALHATIMVAHLVIRSSGFSTSLARGGVGAAVRHAVRRYTREGGPTSLAPPAQNSPPTPAVTKMVLRPDWEREGRVYGLRMPRERTAERAFEYLVDYPCEFQIKVIGINEGSFADDIAKTVSAVCEVCAATG